MKKEKKKKLWQNQSLKTIPMTISVWSLEQNISIPLCVDVPFRDCHDIYITTHKINIIFKIDDTKII